MIRSKARALSLLLVLLLLLSSLVSCGERYKLRAPTEKESTVMMTLGEKYDVTFDMLYTFFHRECADRKLKASDFSGEGGNALLAEVLAAASASLTEIYGFFSAAEEVGIDPFGKETEKEIKAWLKLTVEGGQIGSDRIEGFESYDAYLTYIRKNLFMNDAVNREMFRATVCEELLTDYYENEHRYSSADVEAFFESEACIHLVWLLRDKTEGGLDAAENEKLIGKVRQALLAGNVNGAVSLTTVSAPLFYMGRYTKDRAYYGVLIDTAYSLAVGETSEVIELGNAFYVLKRLPKEEDDLETLYTEIEALYLADTLYGKVYDEADLLLQSIVYTSEYDALTPADFFD